MLQGGNMVYGGNAQNHIVALCGKLETVEITFTTVNM
jgi:hypothetical protein